MLFHVARRELLDQMLSLRFAIACIVCLVVFLLSIGLTTRDFAEASSTYHMNRTMHRNELLQVTSPWDVDDITVERPLNAMNILVRGVAADLTERVKVQRNRLEFEEVAQENAVAALFPDVDFVFIVGVIMSLLALAFAYDAVSGERESGVLMLLMSYSIPRDRVILGKWLGGFLALIGPFAIAFLAGLLVALLMAETDPAPEDALSIAGLFGIALLYIAAMYSLGILVSCRTQTASTSITVLLLVWVTLILAIPNMAPYAATQLMPIPARESVDREQKEMRLIQQRRMEEQAKEEQERTGVEDVWENSGFREKMMIESEKMEEELKKLDEAYASGVQAQTRWSGFAARISPLTSFNLAACDLTATGIEQERRFVEALEGYSLTWQEYTRKKQEALFKWMAEQQREGAKVIYFTEQQEFAVDLSDYPRFEFSYMPFSDRLGLVQLDILLLALWNVFLFMGAYLSFLRCEIN